MRSSAMPLRWGWQKPLALASAALLLAAPPAAAHGLGSEDPNRPVGEYLWLGVKHLLAGWDHLLFILAVVFVAGSLWRATKLLSLFVLGHSLTLALATFQEWRVSTTFVDVVVALSVVAVAVVGLRWRRPNWQILGGGLFVFGLIHGLGLATRLQDLGVSDDSLALRVLLFNIGVEIGQAVAVVAFVLLGRLIAHFWPAPERLERFIPPVLTLIGFAGLIGAMVLSISAVGSDDGPDRVVAAGTTTTTTAPAERCRVIVRDAANPAPGGGHAEQRFYGPDETYPELDFGHSLLDGYIVVTYSPDLLDYELNQLQVTVEQGQEGLLAGAAPGQREAVIATTLRRELRCTRLDTDALAEFQRDWIAEYTGQP